MSKRTITELFGSCSEDKVQASKRAKTEAKNKRRARKSPSKVTEKTQDSERTPTDQLVINTRTKALPKRRCKEHAVKSPTIVINNDSVDLDPRS